MKWSGGDRRLLARIHRYTLKQLRSSIEPVALSVYVRFLSVWHGVGGDQREGMESLAEVIDDLQGFAIAAAAWERDVLPRPNQALPKPSLGPTVFQWPGNLAKAACGFGFRGNTSPGAGGGDADCADTAR